jgi:hypothetical protein
MDIVAAIEAEVSTGTTIPKPEASEPFLVKGWGVRRKERALIYTIPNKRGGKRYEKGVTESELRAAFTRLLEFGAFERSWFDENLAACKNEGTCNFTTIGGLFEVVGQARYEGKGTYRRL